jgi:hypothetical protein
MFTGSPKISVSRWLTYITVHIPVDHQWSDLKSLMHTCQRPAIATKPVSFLGLLDLKVVVASKQSG